MNMKKSFFFMIVILITICISVIIICLPNTSTDMSALIESALSKQYNRNVNIEIFNTYESFECKIVGFTIVGSKKCGFAVMREDRNAQYELVSVYTSDKMIKKAFDIYIEHVYLNDQQHDLYDEYFIVLSINDELSKIQMAIDYGQPTYNMITSTPSLTVIEIPFGTSHLEYLFYDKMDNPIR